MRCRPGATRARRRPRRGRPGYGRAPPSPARNGRAASAPAFPQSSGRTRRLRPRASDAATSSIVATKLSTGSFASPASSAKPAAVMIAPAASALRKSSNWRATAAMRSSNTVQATPLGLSEHLRRLLGIALRLVGEAPALQVHLDSALGDGRPGDQDAVRVRDRAVALVPGEVTHRCSERLAPEERVALVAGMSEIERLRHFGDVARNQGLVAAIAAAGEDRSPDRRCAPRSRPAALAPALRPARRTRRKASVTSASHRISTPAALAASRRRSISSAPERLGKPCMRSRECPG